MDVSYVCMHACMYVCMYVCKASEGKMMTKESRYCAVCMHVCVSMYVCMYVRHVDGS